MVISIFLGGTLDRDWPSAGGPSGPDLLGHVGRAGGGRAFGGRLSSPIFHAQNSPCSAMAALDWARQIFCSKYLVRIFEIVREFSEKICGFSQVKIDHKYRM